MSEIARMTPSQGEYKKERIHLWKEVLKNLIDDIDGLSTKDVIDKLDKYKEVKPWIDKNSNTFEMIALYQKSLQLLWSVKVGKVDALFWWATHRELKEIQEKKLGLKWKDIDGLPGPTTTKKLIKELQKLEKPVEKPTPPASLEKPKAIENSRVKEVDIYLTSTEKYKNDGNWKYTSTDGNHTILVSDTTVAQSTIPSNRKPSIDELRIYLEALNHITQK